MCDGSVGAVVSTAITLSVESNLAWAVRGNEVQFISVLERFVAELLHDVDFSPFIPLILLSSSLSFISLFFLLF